MLLTPSADTVLDEPYDILSTAAASRGWKTLAPLPASVLVTATGLHIKNITLLSPTSDFKPRLPESVATQLRSPRLTPT